MIKYYLLYCDETSDDAEAINAELADLGLINASDETDDDGEALLGADFLFMVVTDAAQINNPDIKNRWEAFDNEIRWKRKPYGEIMFFVPDDGVLKNIPIRLKKYGYYLYDEVVDAADYCDEVIENSQKKERIAEAVPRVKQIKYVPAENTVKQIKYNPPQDTVKQFRYNPDKETVKQIKYNPERETVAKSPTVNGGDKNTISPAEAKKAAQSSNLNAQSGNAAEAKRAAGANNLNAQSGNAAQAKRAAQSSNLNTQSAKPYAEKPEPNKYEYAKGKYDYIFDELNRANKSPQQNKQQKKSGGCAAAIVVFVLLAIIAFVVYSVVRSGFTEFNVLLSGITPRFDFAQRFACSLNALQCTYKCGIIQFGDFCL